ncbi:hypothetical protein [Kineothrix sp. MB12-C1]|uniref:hypothetical protein n=1 Tax=Kineothrix sp. MB12-C1 TaxID=3070215 RepID=UPI0027D261FC|nr:hypothetical protein [Kineothrix sp. MB12-C1]WMC92118.1 hypothetical protein RBB56_14850 [Kineothrix sp. MB12-C1]
MNYETWTVQSVVVIPRPRDYKSGKAVNEGKKEKKVTEENKSFSAILKQVMR